MSIFTATCPRCDHDFEASNKILETCPKCDSEFEAEIQEIQNKPTPKRPKKSNIKKKSKSSNIKLYNYHKKEVETAEIKLRESSVRLALLEKSMSESYWKYTLKKNPEESVSNWISRQCNLVQVMKELENYRCLNHERSILLVIRGAHKRELSKARARKTAIEGLLLLSK